VIGAWFFEDVSWDDEELQKDKSIVYRDFQGHANWPHFDPVGDKKDYYPLEWVVFT